MTRLPLKSLIHIRTRTLLEKSLGVKGTPWEHPGPWVVLRQYPCCDGSKAFVQSDPVRRWGV